MSPAVLRDARAVRFDVLPPLSLYVHLPWCVRKCPYCDFNSHERAGTLPESEYVAALMRDLEGMLPSVWGRRVQTIFIGGGTPSLFSAQAIDGLLAGIRSRLQVEPGAEITMEANPGTAEAARFRGFRDAGVNRLSLGVQSFDDAMLQALGRIHSADEARRAIGLAMEVFGNVNIDLMYALPGQTLAQLEADVTRRWRCCRRTCRSTT
jgi:oxygen-independent coproporphyrinogen-3 oxidase